MVQKLILSSFIALFCLGCGTAALANKSKKEMQEHHKQSNYDYIVVGAGTAGGILVDRLTENCKNSVLVLEWGQDLRNDPNTQTLEGLSLLTDNQRYNEIYVTQGDARAEPFGWGEGFNFPQWMVQYGMGRSVGGTSLHAFVARRAAPEFYDALASIAGPQWSYPNVLPLLKAFESYIDFPNNAPICTPDRGCTGPLKIMQFPSSAFAGPDQTLNIGFANAFRDSTPEVPAPTLDIGDADYNAGQNAYSSSNWGQFWCSNPPGNNPPNFNSNLLLRSTTLNEIFAKITDFNGRGVGGRKLQLRSEAFVTRILFDDELNAIGVEYSRRGKVCRAYAKKKVILSAGTLRNPLILEQSGIGDPAVLASVNIPLVLANPNVGEHMLDQIYLHLAFTTNDPTFVFNCTGRFFLEAGAPPFNLTYPPFVMAGFMDAVFTLITQQCFNFNSLTQTMSFAVPSASEGSVHTATNNNSGQLLINMPFFQNPQDIQLCEMGARFVNNTINLAASRFPGKAIEMVYPPAVAFQPGNESLLDTYLMNEYRTGIHQVGTCRIGQSIADSVVNGNLHVHGVKNLMVADNSIFPIVVDANTMDASLLVGEMAANILLNCYS